MTDKVQKIREEIEKLKSNLVYGDYSSQVSIGIRCKEEAYDEVLSILDTMQKEPKFNVGDTICNKELTVFIYGISEGKYWVKYVSDTFDFGYLEISKQDEWKLVEKLVSEDLEEAAVEWFNSVKYKSDLSGTLIDGFKAGAKWQKQQDQSTIKLAEDHAMLAGMEKMKEEMIGNTVDAMIGLPYENKDGGYTHLIDVSRPLPVGDNKIAIIFKED